MRNPITSLAALVLASLPIAGLASGGDEERNAVAGDTRYLPGAEMTYEVFETAIEHADLDHCPAEFDPETVFCRLTLANDGAHVFIFSHEGDQPLLAVRSYPLDRSALRF